MVMVVHSVRVSFSFNQASDDLLAVLRSTRSYPLHIGNVAVRLLGERQALRIDAEPPRAERLDGRRERDVQRCAPVRNASKSEKRPPFTISPGDDAFE